MWEVGSVDDYGHDYGLRIGIRESYFLIVLLLVIQGRRWLLPTLPTRRSWGGGGLAFCASGRIGE